MYFHIKKCNPTLTYPPWLLLIATLLINSYAVLNTVYAEDELGNPTTDELGTPTTIDARISPESVDFGDIIVNNSSRYQKVKVYNIEQSDMFVGDVVLADSDNFTLKSTCEDKKQVRYNRYCYLKVIFTPKSAGELETTVSIPLFESSSSTTPVLTKILSLIGNGIAAIPNIELESNTVDLGETQVDSGSDYVSAKIKNTGNSPLALGQIGLTGDADIILKYDFCSNTSVSPSSYCTTILQLKPETAGDKAATLSIPSDDPDSPTVEVAITGKGLGWCEGDNFQSGLSIWPQPLDFGIDMIGASHSIHTSVYTWIKGCDGFKVENVSIIGNDAGEFSVENKNCYHGSWRDNSYSSCWFQTKFDPTVAGEKDAQLQVTFNNGNVETVAINAEAVLNGNPALTIEPVSHDFGEATVGVYNYSNHQNFVVKNTGDVNINFASDSISAVGNTDDFTGYQWSWCTYANSLGPNEECWLYSYFVPQELGDRQATIIVDTNAAQKNIGLSGVGAAPADCSDENITIESITSGNWADRTEIGNANGESWYWDVYGTPTNTWKRLKNLNEDEEATPNQPRSGDVVRIKAGHTVSGIPYANVRALCIDKNATLESSTGQSYPYLNVNATDYIENKGTIFGLHGADEDGYTRCDGDYWSTIGKTGCAQPGASIYLNAAIVRNEGTILSGNGGDGLHNGASGGWLSIYGTNITNTDDIGIIRAGRGGNLTDNEKGRAGQGGGISIWGNNSLQSDGQGINAGNGGNCNVNATEAQHGGDGGNMRLNAGSVVNLLAGTFSTGDGGVNCEPLGENGRDGGFNTDPSVLNLNGANVKIEGGDVTIYGGEGWQLNLSNMEEGTITATGDITIAVGPGGSINLTGAIGKALKADGNVNIFADNVKLDDGKSLEDIIEATNIVSGPAKILRDVNLAAPGKLSGEPGDVLPITVTISNGSAEADNFNVSVADSIGWAIEGLTGVDANGSVTVEALQSANITFNVVLGSEVNTTDVITIVAISQSDMSAIAEAKVQLAVVAAEELISSSVDVTDTTDTTDTTTSANDTPFINPSSSSCPITGTINGVCSNNGHLITDATINGSIAGGELSGNITVTGMVSRVTVVEDAVVTGGKFTGTIINNGQINDFDFVGTSLENGTVGGTITSSGSMRGVFKNVSFAADTTLEKVNLQGNIIGDINAPTLLQNLTIEDNTYLEGVIIGSEVILGNNITFGIGVRINDSLLAAINALVKDMGLIVTQNADILQAEDNTILYAVRIAASNSTKRNASLRLTPTQTVHFITAIDLDITAQPAVQNLDALQIALAAINLPNVEVQANGNVKVSASDAIWYSARPDLFSVETNAEIGLSVAEVANFVFEQDGKKRQQSFYAAPADMDALLAVDSSVGLTAQKLRFTLDGTTYSGRVDYEVTQGDVPADGNLQVLEEEDNFVLVYPDGARQKLFSD
ncbi:choice-of-anchor D domain-containing protein [Candidatus Halobeggiatoa sp. HSG11]|nr:choice-of-anchor D domain-containing protein [Candidatus Halobeggiatoa sp. HSG11]